MNLFSYADHLLSAPDVSLSSPPKYDNSNQQYLPKPMLSIGVQESNANLESPSRTKPTLFLLDDILGTMDTTRNKVVERRNVRKERQKEIELQHSRTQLIVSDASAYGMGTENLRAKVGDMKRKTPAGRAASAAKALQATKQIKDEDDARERIREETQYEYEETQSDSTQHAIDNHRSDKKVIIEAVERRLAKDKQLAETAKNRPPKEFVKKLAAKNEARAREAALSAGASSRGAIAAGKAAAEKVKEKYRKAQLSKDAMEEEEEAEEIEYHRLKKLNAVKSKVPVMAVDKASGARLTVDERKSDFTATAQWKLFQEEIHNWDITGGTNEPDNARDGFAEYLTDKYMCGKMDGLPKTIIVTKVRKDIMRIIDNFVASKGNGKGGGEDKGGDIHRNKDKGEEQNKYSNSDSDADSDDSRYNESLQGRSAQGKWTDFALNEQRRKVEEVRSRQLLQVEQREHDDPNVDAEFQEFLQMKREKKTRQVKDKIDKLRKEKELEEKNNNNNNNNNSKNNKNSGSKLFQPWKCTVCSKQNAAEDKKCTVCGRRKNINLPQVIPEADKTADQKKNEMDAMKKENEEHAKINQEYMNFHKMKTKTDAVADERGAMADDITSLLASLRGSIQTIEDGNFKGRLADEVKPPPVEHNEDFRVKNPKGRTDGRTVEEANRPTPDVIRQMTRDKFLSKVGAGKEFSPHEGPKVDYNLTEAERNYKNIKKPFDYDVFEKKTKPKPKM